MGIIGYPFAAGATPTRVLECGSGERNLVLIHGLGARADRWRSNLEPLAEAGYRDGLEAAPRVRCPVLLVLGREDRMTPPRAARALAEAIPSAQTVVLDACGHMSMTERPDRVLDALREAI